MDSYKNYQNDTFIMYFCFNWIFHFMHYLHVGISSHILNNITNNFSIHRLKDQQSNIVQDILLYTRVD